METVIGYVVQEAISYLLVDDNEQSDIAANGQFPAAQRGGDAGWCWFMVVRRINIRRLLKVDNS